MGANNSAMNEDSGSENMPARNNGRGRGRGRRGRPRARIGFVANAPPLIESLEDLRKKVAALSGATFSEIPIQKLLKTRETGKRGRNGRMLRERNSSGAFTLAEKANVVNRFLPNRRAAIERLNTKTFCCLYLPGERIVTASQDEKLRFYVRYQDNYKLINEYPVPEVGWSILDLALNSAGNRLAYGTWSDAVHQCRIEELGEELDWNCYHGVTTPSRSYERFAYFSIRYSMDDEHLVAGGSDGYIDVFGNGQQPSHTFHAHQDDVNAIYCSSNDPHIFCSGSDDGLCKVWDTRSLDNAEPVGVFAGHRDGITYVDGHGDDRYVLTNSKDQTIKIWDMRRFSSKEAEKETLLAVRKQRWDYRYQHIPPVFSSAGPLDGDGSVMTLRGHSVQHTLIRAKFSPEQTGRRFVYTGSTEGTVHIYDILTGEVVRALGGHKSVVRDCCWHPDDNEIISISWDGITAKWFYDGRTEDDPNLENEPDVLSSSDEEEDGPYISNNRSNRRSMATPYIVHRRHPSPRTTRSVTSRNHLMYR